MEEIHKESDFQVFVYAAAVAVLLHALLFFGWSKLSIEESAFAMGAVTGASPSVVMFMEEQAISIPESFPPPQPALPEPVLPEVERPSEFVKQANPKPKKAVQKPPQKRHVLPAASISNSPSTNENRERKNVNGDKTTEETVAKRSGDIVRPGAAGESVAVAEPDYLTNPPPAYPRESRKNREQGVVFVFAQISQKGTVLNLKLKKSSGYERLDNSALEAVRDWRFKPAKFAGLPIDTTVEIPVRFALK